jgi:lipoyl(octanoyl) transferase
MPDHNAEVWVRQLGVRNYAPVWEAMRAFTTARIASTTDEIWLVEHPPVFTRGLNARHAPDCATSDIPVVHSDRGGQMTYHGPGQIVAYVLLDLRRRGLGVRHLVNALEQSVIDLLAHYGVSASPRRDAPGVYVDGAKIAALGLRVRQGCCYHGLSLNLAMDLAPYAHIHPCGHPGLPVTDMRTLGIQADFSQTAVRLVAQLAHHLGYTIGIEHPIDVSPPTDPARLAAGY